MVKRIALGVLCTLIASPAFAGGRYFYARGCIRTLPTTPGEAFHFYGSLVPPSGHYGFVGLIPLDWDNHQHTMIMEGEVVSVSGTSAVLNLRLQIFTDAGPATPLDYANPMTFRDGTLIASGAVDGYTYRRVFPPTFSLTGSCAWDGGTRLSEILARPRVTGPPDQFTGGSSTLAPPVGYAESWDLIVGDMDFPVESTTWGTVKALYR